MSATVIEVNFRDEEVVPEPSFLDCLYKRLKFLNLLNIFAMFTLNFYGSPELKYLILGQIFITGLTVYLYSFQKALPFIIILFFFEGQGRIVWHYHPFFRGAFDLVLLIGFFKTLVQERTESSKSLLPPIYSIFIFLHFIWYVFSLSSPNNHNFINSLLTVKMFIFPFLFFFYFMKNPIDFDSEDFRHSVYLILLCLFGEIALIIFQTTVKESLLYSISSYYSKGRGGDYVGPIFRAWGTSYRPAAISSYFALIFPVCFLYNNKEDLKHSAWTKFIAIASTPLTLYCLYLMQVRSSMIRYLLVVAGILIVMFFKNRNRVKRIVQIMVVACLISIPIINLSEAISDKVGSFTMDHTYKRFTMIFDSNYKVDRLGVSRFVDILSDKLTFSPFGLGPGSSFYDLSQSGTSMEFRPVDKWHYENFMIAMFTDFGWGSVILLFIYYSLPAFIILLAFKSNAQGSIRCTKSLFFVAVGLTVIMIGEWFSYGLTFNPTSFIYWFLVAQGLSLTKPTESAIVDDDQQLAEIINFAEVANLHKKANIGGPGKRI